MNKTLLKEAQDSLAVEDVFLRECRATINPDFDPKIAPPDFQLQYKMAPKRITKMVVEDSDGNKKDMIRIEIDTGMRLIPADVSHEILKTPEDEAKHVKVQISATFVAEYRLTKTDVAKEALDEFAIHNVGYHVWPYWREFVQSMCSRMLLPNIVLPMYRRASAEVAEPAARSERLKGS